MVHPCLNASELASDIHLVFHDACSQGRIQFFIEALDKALRTQISGLQETEAFINLFPINLELELGAAFTERITYTGIYNISGQGFDMSFRVQCSGNYYGPNCATFYEPMEGLYACDSEGNRICVQRGRDPVTNCTTCLPELDPETDCTTCLSTFYDPSTNCTECFPNIQIECQPTTITTLSKYTHYCNNNHL
jgi:hypothetical protein